MGCFTGKAVAVAIRARTAPGGQSQRMKPTRETLVKVPRPKPHGLEIYSIPDQFKLPYRSPLSQKLCVAHVAVASPRHQ